MDLTAKVAAFINAAVVESLPHGGELNQAVYRAMAIRGDFEVPTKRSVDLLLSVGEALVPEAVCRVIEADATSQGLTLALTEEERARVARGVGYILAEQRSRELLFCLYLGRLLQLWRAIAIVRLEMSNAH